MTSIYILSLFMSSLAVEQAKATRLEMLTLLPSDDGLLAVLEADGPLEHRVVQEQNPGRRIILDVLGVSNPLRHYYPPETHPFLERILMYEYPEATNPNHSGPLARIVFELKQEVDYRVEARDNTLRVTFAETGAFDDADAVAPWSGDGDGEPGVIVDSEEDSDDLTELENPEPELGVESDESMAVEEETTPNVPPNVSIQPEDVSPDLFFAPGTGESGDYRLGPEDVIEVRVFELDQLNRTVRVSGDGHIDLPLVGRLRASGLTAEEVASEIASRLRDRFVQNPQVSIFVTEFNSQTVALLGAVQSPSSYPLTGQRRLLQVLAEAGSLAPDAGRTLYLFRQTADGRSARLTVPLNELMLQGDPRWNVALRPGDVVSIPPEQAIAVSILGAVNDPGVHKLPVGDEATLLKAVALAGGLNERASKKGIQIKRRGEDGKETILKVNLGDILSGKSPDVILHEGDVVVINESFF